MRIKEVTVKHAQKIVNKWAKKTDQYRVLHSSAVRIFNYAMNLGTIDRNPLERVIMPKREKSNKEAIKVYSKVELKRLFNYLNSKEGSYRSDYDKTLMRFMIYSGIRISEALALNWNDIDFQNNNVNIDKTLSQTKHGYIISDPKTNSSSAKLTLDDTTIKTLKKMAN